MSESTEVQLTAPFDPVPFTLVGPPDDLGVIGQIRRSGGTYEPRVMSALRRLLKPTSVAIDIGANIGVFAVVMARLCPRGTVYAFEPAVETYGYLVANLEANGGGNAVAEQVAAYGTTGTVQFVFSPGYPPGSFVGERPTPGGETRTVEAVRIDDYVERLGIDRVDLIMVDAEGAEVSVLQGAVATLARHRPALLVEMNPALLQRLGGTSYRELADLLRRHHDLYAIGDDGAPARIVSQHHLDLLLRKEGVIDLCCLPRSGGGARRGGALGARGRGARQLAALQAEFDGSTAPKDSFLVEPAFEIGLPPETLRCEPGLDAWLTVPVHNASPCWFSSDSLYYPVHLSYRWYDADGNRLDVLANRGRFDPPLAPGGSQVIALPVRFPSEPGAYELALTMVQENYAWFDDLDPTLQLRLPATVLGHVP